MLPLRRYKIHVSLPDPPVKDEAEEDVLEALLASEQEEAAESEHTSAIPPRPTQRTREPSVLSMTSTDRSLTHPSTSTQLLYSNTIVTLIGVCTLLLLWTPLPLLHYTGVEPFRLPPPAALPSLGMVVATGVAFNAGFVLLITIWGPVISSVGNLCTLLLVAVADTVITGVPLPWSTLVGSGLVVAAFGGLIAGAAREKAARGGEGREDSKRGVEV